MPKVFLFGYYGFGNLGDELLRAYYINLLRNHFPGAELIVLSNTTPAPPEQEKLGYTVVNRWHLWRVRLLINPGDLLVGGGGSIFQDWTSKRSLLYYLTLLQLARQRRAVIYLIGQGIGPLSPWGRKVAGPVLNQASTITCRDRESYTALREMGVISPLLYLGVDPLWDYPVPALPAEPAPGGARRSVGYIFRSGEFKKKRSLLAGLNSRFGSLRLITLSPGDAQAARKMAEEMGLLPPRSVNSLKDFLALVPELTMVLSERLHGLLLAARCGLVGIGLSDDPKVHAFCYQMQWTCWGWAEPDLTAKVGTALEAGLATADSAAQQVRRQAELMEKKGEEDRQWLLQQLGKALTVK